MNYLNDFIKLSRYAGERFDLIQAGGGNSSVKVDEKTMLIKASGHSLSSINEKDGYSAVDYAKVNGILQNAGFEGLCKKERETLAKKLFSDCYSDKKTKPSIETFLHSSLGKFVLHTHPVAVNALTARQDWKDVLKKYFPEAIFVGYKTPGIDLALELKKELDVANNFKNPSIIFLQNHGLIVSSEHYKEVITLTDSITLKLEKASNLDLSPYRATNRISGLYNEVSGLNHIAYCICDYFIKQVMQDNTDIISSKPFCPDKLVYCGISVANINSFNDKKALFAYLDKYKEFPKILEHNRQLYILSETLKKTKDIEEVFKFHLMCLANNATAINYLTDDELEYLSNWDAEKYRQNLS